MQISGGVISKSLAAVGFLLKWFDFWTESWAGKTKSVDRLRRYETGTPNYANLTPIWNGKLVDQSKIIGQLSDRWSPLVVGRLIVPRVAFERFFFWDRPAAAIQIEPFSWPPWSVATIRDHVAPG